MTMNTCIYVEMFKPHPNGVMNSPGPHIINGFAQAVLRSDGYYHAQIATWSNKMQEAGHWNHDINAALKFAIQSMCDRGYFVKRSDVERILEEFKP